MAKAYTILDQAASLLNDPRGEFWPRAELLGYLNAGLKAMVPLAPSQFSVTQTVTLAAGARQTLPAGSVALLQANCIVNNDDSIGRTVRNILKAALDAASPSWMSATPTTPREVAYDPKVPDEYWVNPPASAGVKLQVATADEPDELAVFTEIPVDSRFHPALLDYVLFRALSKDADFAKQETRAAQHYQAFQEGISGRPATK